MTEEGYAVLAFIATRTKPTAVSVMKKFPRENRFFGRQRWASQQIAYLRRLGYLEDCERCEHCGRALTRGRRNVVLSLTDAGWRQLKMHRE